MCHSFPREVYTPNGDAVENVNIYGGSGNDTLTINAQSMITAFLFNADGGSDTLIVNRSPGVSYGSNPFNGNVTFLGGYKSIAYLNVEILTTN